MNQNKVSNTKGKILIVDDSEMNRAILSDMLSDEFDIVEVENGLEASAVLHNHEQEFSLVLLDIVMPVMDGFEFLAVMNENGWIKSIPVVMISAETVPSYVDRAYDLGVLDYISRPFDERVVRRRVMSTIMLSSKQKELSYMVAEQMLENEKNSQLMVEILSNIVEFRNGESGMHVLHIRILTEMLLKRLLEKTDKYGISRSDISMICNASALHDIGKIAVPSEVLNKPGKLTKEEFEIMKTHAAEGGDMLKSIPLRQDEPLIKIAYQICRWHHERYDGRGYPDGLKGEEIPIAAQVVALADVYDALTSKRVYKDAYSHEKAVSMILGGECGIFNPFLLECLNDISEQLEEELHSTSSDHDGEREIVNTVEQMLDKGDFGMSGRTLKLLEQERTKYKFYADMSHEIQFEYTITPEILILSEWGAQYLNLPETIYNPRENFFGTEVFNKEDFEKLLERLKHTTPKNPNVEMDFVLNINGRNQWSKIQARSMWTDDEEPQYTGAIGKIVDIHKEREKMEQLTVMADHDPLTGLLNHRAAKRYISSILDSDSEKKYILLFFDLDHFKQANDTYGHQFGDEVLRCVADKIRENTRGSDIAARMGGDEFLIFMSFKNSIEPLVKRIFDNITCEYREFSIRLSMGVASAEECKGDYEKLFKMADQALYAVKRSGRNSYRIYDPQLPPLTEEGSC